MEGFTGRRYELDFKVGAGRNTKLVKLVGSQSQSNIQSNIDRVISTWFDISLTDTAWGAENKDLRVSLLDDTSSVFRGDHISLINKISSVCFWSDQEHLRQTLKVVA